MEKVTVTPELLKNEFLKLYGNGTEKIRMFASPARINIIGEHIDYNGGKVFPAAIDKYLYVAIRKRNDSKITYNDLFFPGTFSFDVNDDFKYIKENDYANFLNGILSIMKRQNHVFPCGFDVLIASNVPSAGGISSSSALECGFAWAVSETFNFNISRKDIALMGQQSEHEFMNVNCGIMDQYIISTGKKNTAEILDCAKIQHEYVPLNLGDYRFVVMNTKKQRKLSDSKYNERRAQCEEGLDILQKNGVKIPDLCSMTPEQFEKNGHFIKDEVIYKRVRHCVTEMDRVQKAVAALKANNLSELGKLLYASHNSLKNDYEVTGIELDTLVDVASKQEGCIGARMTGAGFGGCAIALVHKDKVQSFMENVQKEYTKVVGYQGGFFACSSGDGVSEIFEKKYVCLSFDDGPNKNPPETMNDMLDILEKYQVPGSFFIIGNKVTEENKKVIRRAFNMGCDIQNHSWTHPDMTSLTAEQIQEEYEKCDQVIKEITGKKAEFFRPPYIAVNADMYRLIKVPFICGKGCNDWDNNYDAEYRYQTMLNSAEDGTIFLLHVMEGNIETLKAVDRIIPALKEQGYEFVTVPDLFKIKNQKNAINGANWSVVK